MRLRLRSKTCLRDVLELLFVAGIGNYGKESLSKTTPQHSSTSNRSRSTSKGSSDPYRYAMDV